MFESVGLGPADVWIGHKHPGDWMTQFICRHFLSLLFIAATAVSIGAAPLNPSPMQTTEAELNKLLEYQLFGADYIKAGHNFGLNNPKGYVGSNRSFQSTGGGWVIKPIIRVGGEGTGNANFTNGNNTFENKVIIEGSLTLQNTNTFLDTLATFSVPSGTASGAGEKIFDASIWPTAMRNSINDLSIPTLDWASCNSDVPAYPKGANIDVNSGNVSLPNTLNIDLTALTDTVIDLCLGSVNGNTNGYQVWFHQEPWQLIRVFVNGNMSGGHNFKFGTYTTTTVDAPTDYRGTLLVYVNGLLNITGNNGQLIGSYIYPHSLYFGHDTKLTGQLLAQSLEVQDGFNGALFKYVPFNPPVLEPTVNFDNGLQLTENNTAVRTLTVQLDKPAIIAVTMDWAFDFSTAAAPQAKSWDLTSTTLSGTLSILAGDSTATISVRVMNDDTVEGTENFYLVLSNINGAVFPGNAASMSVALSILDNDDNFAPSTQDETVTATEDVVFSFAAGNFTYIDPPPGSTTFTSISVRSLPDQGTLFYDTDNDGAYDAGEDIVVPRTISVALIPRLKFLSDPNENGVDYTDFQFTVSDGFLSSAQGKMTINVTAVNDAPTLASINPVSMLEDQDSAIALTVGDPDGIPVGQPTVTSSNLTLFPAGSITFTGSGATRTMTLNPAADQNGSSSITVTFSDGSLSMSRTFAVTVTAVNDAPSFTEGTDRTVDEDAPAQTITNWATSLSAGPSDESGQTLSFVVTNTNNALFSAQPTIAANGTLTFMPAANQSGAATVTVRIQDTGGTANGGVNQSASQTFIITVNSVNDEPSFMKGGDVTVLEDAGAISVSAWATTILAGGGESQTLTFYVTAATTTLFSAQPAIASNGTLTFTPAANANGSTTVTVYLGDNGGTTNGGDNQSAIQTFIIYITPVNDVPSFTKGADQTVNEDVGIRTVNPWATSLSKGPADESGQSLTFTVSGNTNPSLFSAGPFVNSAGVLTYTPASNANGVATITLYVKDNGLTANGGVDQSATQTFTITVNPINDNPVANNDATSTAQDVAVVITTATVLANDTDVDGDTLSVTSVQGATHGSVSINAGNITFTPTALYSGPASFTYTISDGHGGTATGTVNIAVSYVNMPPTLGAIGNQTINEDVLFTQVGTGNDVDVGDALTYTLVAFPAGMTIDATSGLISWTPTNAQVSATAYTVTVHVQDKFNTSPANRSFLLTVQNVNDAPVLASIPNQNATEDQVFTITVSATDEDLIVPTVSEVLTFSLTAPPAGMTIDATTGVIQWVPTNAQVGSHVISVVVNDAYGGSDTETFTVVVSNVNDIPTLNAIADRNLMEDQTLSVTAVGSDVDAGDVLTYSLTAKPTGMTINTTTGEILWTPGNSDVRDLPYTVTVRVTDSQFGFAEETFLVTVLNVNDAPVLAAIANQSTNEDELYAYQVIATDVDQSINPNESLEFFLDLAPVGMQITSTGLISWTPGSADVGVHTLRVVVADLAGLSDTVTYQLTVLNVNDAPVFAALADTSTLEDVPFTRTIRATDADAGDDLTYTFISKPLGMVINSSTGVISWTPDNSRVGDHIISVRATDESGLFVEKTFTLTVVNVNDAPVIDSPSFTIAEDAIKGAFVGQVSATDIDVGSVLSYKLIQNDKFTVGVDGTIKVSKPLDYEANPVETLYVAVTDGYASDTARLIIQISNVVETSVVEIIQVRDEDSTWDRPDTVWTSDEFVDVTWTKDGVTQVDRIDVDEGVNIIIREFKGPGKDTYGRDTVVVLVNRQIPEIELVLPPERPLPKPNTVIEDPLVPVETTAEGDTIYYINKNEKSVFAQVILVGKDLKLDTLIIRLEPDLVEGLNTVEYSYVDVFGNEATGEVVLFLDLTPPKVEIVRPLDSTKTTQFVIPVTWTVDGRIIDTLNQQSLVVGWNVVIRTYRDRAGNEGSDTVWVFLKAKDKDVSITLENPLVLLDRKKVEKFYEINPPEDDEYFALSYVNTQTGLEEEKQFGMGAQTKKGDDTEPYPGLMGRHLGPTLRLEIKLPHMGGNDAAGKPRGGDIQSILEPDGRIAISEGAGEDRELIPLSEYIEDYCLEDAFKGLSPGELLEAPIFRSKIYIETMVYDAIGQFVDNMKLSEEVANHKYLSDGGMLTGYLEIKPRKDEGLKNQRGRSYGTGAYVIRGKVDAVSVQLCDTPTGRRGDKIKNSSETLQNFGFRRESK